ncbi:MAG: AAA family ATPase [Chlamydiia bacterium]|nr:AAA family ATPase [Chlamydiia bacterium]
MKKLPIGIQSIKKILDEGEYIYVDKTGFIKRLIDEGAPYFFMSRPRRFGKSLFLNTLEEIFKGNKELFKALEIYDSEYSWEEHPVLHFDFAQIASSTIGEFNAGLKAELERMGALYGVSVEGPSVQFQLKVLVEALSKQNRVVVLVDEYDSAIINNLKDPELAEKNRDLLKGFFGTLKGLDRYLKFTFITGVSKFSQVSLFSGPNNLTDITMDPKYAGMMGYTEAEVRVTFQDYIKDIAKQRSKQKVLISEEELLNEIRNWYNGYRFSEGETCVYNPFSTLKFMQNKRPKTYWYSSGTPSFLIDELKKHPESMISLDGTTATEEELMDISRLDKIDLTALMYQTGYFTIKGYNPISKRYQLGLPNEEVRSAFINSLVQNFTSITNLRSSQETVKALEEHKPGLLFKQIEIGLCSFAYQVFVDAKERTYQAMLLSMLYGMGFDPLSERTTNTGRIDVVLEVPKTTYILELKLNDSADKALKQIHEKQYFRPYTHKGKQIVIMGANFSSELRNVSDWKGELLSESGEKIKDILPEKGD